MTAQGQYRMAYKHWIFAFEGLRGLAYVSALVSVFAPSFLAFYLLSPQEFFRVPWPAAALIATSIGALAALASMLGVILGRDQTSTNETQNVPIGENEARAHLALGPMCGLTNQLLALLWCIAVGGSFHDYVQAALVISLVGGLILYAISSFGTRREQQEKSPSEVN